MLPCHFRAMTRESALDGVEIVVLYWVVGCENLGLR